MVHILDVCLQRLGTALGQASIILVGTLGRSKALDRERANGDVAIVLHRVDSTGNLTQLVGVIVVVGVNLGATNRKIDIGRALQGASLDNLDLRTQILHLRREEHARELLDQGVGIRPQLTTAAAIALATHHQRAVLHPVGVGEADLVVDNLGCTMLTIAHILARGWCKMLVAGVVDVAHTTIDATRTQHHALVVLDNGRGDDRNLAILDLESRSIKTNIDVQTIAHALHCVSLDGNSIDTLSTRAYESGDSHNCNNKNSSHFQEC